MTKLGKTQSVGDAISAAFPGETMNAEVRHIEHHLAHLASSYLCSPFDKAVNLSVDGMGDFASAAWGVGHGTRIEVEDRVYFPHSLGVFYQAMTQYLGFPYYGDEYKVMGLAPYGKPVHFERIMRDIGTSIMFFGGYAPSAAWNTKWVPAAAVNVGQPKAAMTKAGVIGSPNVRFAS